MQHARRSCLHHVPASAPLANAGVVRCQGNMATTSCTGTSRGDHPLAYSWCFAFATRVFEVIRFGRKLLLYVLRRRSATYQPGLMQATGTLCTKQQPNALGQQAVPDPAP